MRKKKNFFRIPSYYYDRSFSCDFCDFKTDSRTKNTHQIVRCDRCYYFQHVTLLSIIGRSTYSPVLFVIIEIEARYEERVDDNLLNFFH